MRRSKSGQRQKVEQSRAIVAQALGDAARRDGPQVAKFVPTAKAAEPTQPMNEAIGVLTLREAATRLEISTGEMEAMVRRGEVRAVEAGWTVMVLTADVNSRSNGLA
jgi:hypothetical protein